MTEMKTDVADRVLQHIKQRESTPEQIERAMARDAARQYIHENYSSLTYSEARSIINTTRCVVKEAVARKAEAYKNPKEFFDNLTHELTDKGHDAKLVNFSGDYIRRYYFDQ